jgi:hypothetical protein
VRELNFVVLFASSALTNIGRHSLCVSPGVRTKNAASAKSAAALISFIGLASMLGRVGLGALADHIGLIRLHQVTVLVLRVS